jgi:hypothetical protein
MSGLEIHFRCKQKTVHQSIPKSPRNQSRVFECFNHKLRICLKPEVVPVIRVCYLNCPHCTRNFSTQSISNTSIFTKAKQDFRVIISENVMSLTCWVNLMASVLVVSSSNKVISRVSYPHGLSFRPNNSCYLFL